MRQKLKARTEMLKAKLHELRSGYGRLTREVQAVSDEFVQSRGALEEACYHLKELARQAAGGDQGGGF